MLQIQAFNRVEIRIHKKPISHVFQNQTGAVNSSSFSKFIFTLLKEILTLIGLFIVIERESSKYVDVPPTFH